MILRLSAIALLAVAVLAGLAVGCLHWTVACLALWWLFVLVPVGDNASWKCEPPKDPMP